MSFSSWLVDQTFPFLALRSQNLSGVAPSDYSLLFKPDSSFRFDVTPERPRYSFGNAPTQSGMWTTSTAQQDENGRYDSAVADAMVIDGGTFHRILHLPLFLNLGSIGY